MTTQQVKALLNEFYPPLQKYQKRIARNSNLTNLEVDILCEFVSAFEAQGEKYDWESGVVNIIPIIKRFQSTDTVSVSTNKAGIIPKNPDPYPFLITQVLFYLGVACSFYEKDGKPLAAASKILEVLSNKGLKLSHNFYTKLNVNSYVEMLKYRQPQMLFNYNGQKHKEFGVALKHLVYQAGAYNTFLDVFGGSGAASVAFPRRRNAKYYYNDVDEDLTNLFEIIIDDEKHSKLIDYLGYLQEDLRGGREWDIDVDICEEGKKYHNYRLSKPKEGETDDELEIREVLENIDIYREDFENPEDENSKVKEDHYDDILGFMHELYIKLTESGINYEGKDELLKAVFTTYSRTQNPYDLVPSFLLNYSYILDFLKTNHIPMVDDFVFINQLKTRRIRLYEYYAYFNNILDGRTTCHDEVMFGVATIFINSLLTNGATGISAILRDYVSEEDAYKEGRNKSTELSKFLDKDFSVIIENLYSKMKKNDKLLAKRQSNPDKSLDTRTVIETRNCFELLDIYSRKEKTLIYSDSPYLKTTGYKAGIFTEDDMDRLIKALFNSNNKFIFSCRACLSKQRGNNLTKVRKGNKELLEWLFYKFKGNKLYVLTVGKDFWKQVRDNDITEIFITNYEIHGFTDNQFPDINYIVYDYNTFMDLLLTNINI